MTWIIGRPGPETLTGTAAADFVLDPGGADLVSGREGSDVILAGPGADTVAGDNQPVPGLSAEEPGFGPVPAAFGGSPGDNLIFAGSGDDLVVAGFGSDTVLGEAGADTIFGYGRFGGSPTGHTGVIAADGADWLSGGGGDDLVYAGGGDDRVAGGAGADTIAGGVGVDTLAGGSGPDVFVFGRAVEPFTSAPAASADSGVGPGKRDVILDFEQGEDRLDLRLYANFLARPGVASEPVFLGADPFIASTAPQVRYDVEDGRTVVQVFAPLGNPPSDLPPRVPGGPGVEIELIGEYRLGAGDFILA